jgi:Domain of unknown function (DUF4351)
MTRNVHDQFAKEWMQELLVDFGEVEVELQVSAEIRKVDVYFKPHPIADPAPETLIGSFGKMLTTPALIEPFRNAVSPDSVEDCFEKLLAVRGTIRRKAKRDKHRLLESERPRLWIISPTISPKLLEVTEGREMQGWPQGVYFLTRIQRTALIAVHQLPINLDTLWLRLFGRDQVQIQAVREVLALPEHHPYKYQTIEHLARLQMSLQARQNESRLFKEVAMNLSPVYDEWKEKTIAEGREQGLSLGREQGLSLGREQGLSLGREQGLSLGREQGIPFGQLDLLKRQLTAKFDRLSPQALEQLDRLDFEQSSALAIALLSFSELADFDRWLQENQR